LLARCGAEGPARRPPPRARAPRPRSRRSRPGRRCRSGAAMDPAPGTAPPASAAHPRPRRSFRYAYAISRPVGDAVRDRSIDHITVGWLEEERPLPDVSQESELEEDRWHRGRTQHVQPAAAARRRLVGVDPGPARRADRGRDAVVDRAGERLTPRRRRRAKDLEAVGNRRRAGVAVNGDEGSRAGLIRGTCPGGEPERLVLEAGVEDGVTAG